MALPEAAVFDWDGTIVDTIGQIYRANVAALGRHGIVMTRDWFRTEHTPDWRKAYADLGVPEELWDETAHHWSLEMGKAPQRAMPWARGGLRRLRRHGVRLGLVTASTRAVVLPNVDRLNLAGVFETVWCADDVARGKPDPEGLLRALDVLGVPPSRTVYVGDTVTDLQMAVAAGVSFAAVGETTTEEAFRRAGVDRIWPGVGAWVDDLLGVARPARRGSRAR